jgi:hypothetical protein
MLRTCARVPTARAARRARQKKSTSPPRIFFIQFFFKKVVVERRRQGNLRRGKRRPSENLDTGKAGPPRCLVRWQCDSPRSLVTSGRSAGRDHGRNSAVSPAVPQPFLNRFSTQMDKKLGFEGQKRLKDHRQRHNRWLEHQPRPSRRHVHAQRSSPRGDQRSWGVALPSDQASRRASLACVRVLRGAPFPPGDSAHTTHHTTPGMTHYSQICTSKYLRNTKKLDVRILSR